MAAAASKSSANTDLYVGSLSASIGIFPTKATPDRTGEFDTAGPNGGVLKYQDRAAPKPVEEQPADAVPVVPGSSDPLAGLASVAVQEAEAEAAKSSARRLAELGDTVAALTDPAGSVAAVSPGAGTNGSGAGRAPVVDGAFARVLVEEGSGEVVERDDVRRGVRLADGRFVDCTDQLDAIVERTKLDRMDVVAVIDSTRVRRERVIESYYIGAQDTASLPVMRLLYEGLRERRQAAVVKFTKRSRQSLGVIVPNATTGTLMLLTLVWSEDFREAPVKATKIQGAQVTEQHVAAMVELLGHFHGSVDDLDELSDDALRLRRELRTRAESGEMDVSVVEPLPQQGELGLEDALEAALEAVHAR